MNLDLGSIKNIIGKRSDGIVSKITGYVKDEWEKFKIDSDIAFLKYLDNSYGKYSKIKTLLYRTEPKYLYDFFEYPTLKLKSANRPVYVDSKDINKLLDISHYLIIKGTGGIGKSTFMKHLFINELEKNDLIPIFIELKNINEFNDTYDIKDFVFKQLYDLGIEFDKKYLEYALQAGCFLFLLDGYDEIVSTKKDKFYNKIVNFCDRYSGNYFIISSRPYSEFVEFQRFTILSLCDLNKKQAISLVSKIEYDENIKIPFCKALEETLYEKHKSFASNPLLLNIMLLTYDNYAEIPEKLHLFYANAFDTLYSKHDATKGGYKRELKTKLSLDQFKKVFSNFCFLTYYHGKYEFSNDDLNYFIKKSLPKTFEIVIDDMVYDLINSVCLLYKDGLNYRFAHRSFQEYFAAIFIKELPDENFKKMSLELINKDHYRATHDNVFEMLYDMCENRVEQNIFVPILEEKEKNCKEDKYDYYFKLVEVAFLYDFFHTSEDIKLCLMVDTGDEDIMIIRKFIRKYVDFNKEKDQKASIELLEYLESNKNYEIGDTIYTNEEKIESELYLKIKETWIGETIKTLSTLKETLYKKKEDSDMDLNEFLL